MENKLEQLLNSLIKRGRVPFGDEKIHSFEIIYVTGKIRNIVAKRGRGQVNNHYSIRDICSKSSGLWQFCCKNKMIKGFDTSEYYTNYRRFNKENFTECRYLREYQYRIIESALKDESELEDFLLTNIKIDG